MSRSALPWLALVAPIVALAAPRRVVTEDGPRPAPDEQMRMHMDAMLTTFRLAQPYVSSEERFASAQNQAAVQSLLDGLAANAGALRHLESIKGPGMALTANVLIDHVEHTAATFREGRKEQARWMLNTALTGCIACHSQLPANSVRPLIDEQKLDGTLLDQADLLFAARQFEAAGARYLKVVSTADWAQAASRPAAETALRRLLALDLRVRRSVPAAKQDLAKAKAVKGLPEELAAVISAWQKALGRPELNPGFDPAKVTPPQLAKWTHKVLAGTPKDPSLLAKPEQAVPLLVASGVLYEFLSKNRAGGEVSAPLLDLARCDRALNGSYFFSLSDLYLQQCVRRAAKTPLAKSCFDELQASLEFQFTGSRGTEIPKDLRDLLDELRALAP